jgi:hypothetical protein
MKEKLLNIGAVLAGIYALYICVMAVIKWGNL